MKPRDAERSKNFFALGLISWMYTRPVEPTHRVDRPEVRHARRSSATPTSAAFKAGLHFGETAELFEPPYEIQPAALRAGHVPQHHRQPRRRVRAHRRRRSRRSLPILYASYPITPASDILHELSKHKNFGVRTLQAEDEIAGDRRRDRRRVRRSARRHRHERSRRRPQGRGARPRDQPRAAAGAHRRAARRAVHRAADQDRAVRPAARDVRPPRRVAAADRRRASRRATASTPRSRRRASRSKYRTPVILLTDGYLANGAEPWLLPDVDALPDISVPFADRAQPRRDGTEFWPYLPRPRDPRPPVGDPGHARA